MKKCCIRTCISLLVFIVIIAIGVVVLLNLTPAQLHLADKSVGGHTLADYGLGDVKLIKIIKGVRALGQKESKVVSNSFDLGTEKTASDTLFADSNYADKTNFAQISEEDVIYDQRYLRGAADTTLAFVLDDVFYASYTTGGSNGSSGALRVKELTITKVDNEGVPTGHARVVIGVSIASFLDNASAIMDTINKVKIIKIPEFVYVVCNADFTVGTEGVQAGKIIFQNYAANVGADADNPLNGLLFGIINRAMGQESSDDSAAAFSTTIFDKVAATINHIGEIGTANTSVDGKFVVVGSVTYGMAGVADGKLFFITTKD